MHATHHEASARKARRPGATVIARTVMGTPVGEPIRLDRRRRSLAAVVRRHADQRRQFIVSIHRPGDSLLPQDHTIRTPHRTQKCQGPTWSETLVEPSHVVLITYIPRGGSGGASGQNSGKQIGSALAMLALMVTATIVAPGIGNALVSAASGGLFTTASAGTIAAIQGALVIGGTYALSLAARAKANSQDSDTRPVYGVSGGGNLPRPGDRIPVLYGRCWSQPDLTQPDYTQFDGEDQIIYKRMTLGLGKYDVEEIHVGKSVLWTKTGGVQSPFNTVPGGGGGRGDSLGFVSGEGGANVGLTAVEIIPPGGTSTLVPGSVYSHPSVVGIELPRPGENPSWSGPFASCEPGRTTSKIQLDYELPMGVANTGTSEPNYPGNWSVVFQIAPCDQDDVPTGPWATLHANGGTHYWSRAQRFSRVFDVPAGRYLVRAQNAQPYRDILVNTVVWSGLRSHFPETIVRPHVTEIALRIRSGKALGVTAFADVWVKATRILRVWDNDTETWTEQPTRKAVWAYLDVLTAEYGANVSDDRVDVATLAQRAATITADDTYDGVIRGPVSVWEAASVVLGPLRAEPLLVGSIWSIVRDEPKAARKHVFTRRQIKRGTSMAEFQIARDDGAADVIVEYHPDADPRRRREARATVGAQSLTPMRAKVEGVASWNHAMRLAQWMALSAFWRRQSRTFTTDRQGRLVDRGDPIVADVWFLDEGTRTGGVMARDGLDLALDTAMEVGADTYAYLRDRRGRDWGPVKVTQPDPEAPNVIALDAADVAAVEAFHGQSLSDVLARDNEDMTTVRVGPLAVLQRSYLVRAVRPSGLDAIEIECRHDAPEVWTALAEPLPPEPVVPSIGDAADPAYPTVPWVRARCVAKAANLAMEWACGTARGAASYVVMLSYDDGATWEEVSDGLVTSGSYQIRHEPGAQVKVLAYAIGMAGSPGPTVFTTFSTFAATVTPDTMEPGIRDYVETKVGASQRAIEKLIQRVAALAAEVDAATWRDRQQIKTDLQSQSEQAWAGISTVQTVATSNTAALASLSTTVTARFGTLEASVQQVQAAVADVNGKLGAIWGVKVDAGRRVQSLYLFDDGTTAGVAFTVDTFTIALGSNGPEAAVPAFVAVVDDGVPTFAFNGVLKAGAVKTDHIAARAINTDKIAINGVDLINIVEGAATGTVAQAVPSTTVTIPGTGGNYGYYVGTQNVTIASVSLMAKKGVFIIDASFYADTRWSGIPTFPNGLVADIVIDGTVSLSMSIKEIQNPNDLSWTIVGTFIVPHVVSGLSLTMHTVSLVLRLPATRTGTYGQTVQVNNALLRVMELRR